MERPARVEATAALDHDAHRQSGLRAGRQVDLARGNGVAPEFARRKGAQQRRARRVRDAHRGFAADVALDVAEADRRGRERDGGAGRVHGRCR